MARKLQVFVSSTYTDLREERQAAVAAILLAGHIPAGMELFTAGDEAQLAVIRRWIEDSDVYMLICGARYGSVDPKSGLGYTEYEYDLATQLKKPSFAVVMNGPRYDKALQEHADAGGPQLQQFRSKVLSRISSTFESVDQMKLGIVTALRDIAVRDGLEGWVRASELQNLSPLIAQIQDLQRERDALRSKGAMLVLNADGKKLAGLEDKTELLVTWKSSSGKNQYKAGRTWGTLFALIYPKLAEHPADITLKSMVARRLAEESGKYLGDRSTDFTVDEHHWETFRTQMQALGLVTLNYSQSISKSMHLFWNATANGNSVGMQLRADFRPV